MSATPLHRLSVTEQSTLLAGRDVSSVELTQHYLDRIAADAALNAFITVTPDLAIAQARAADARIARGEGGPLTGVPYAHKDIFCTQGVATTCGSRMLAGFVSPYDATVTRRLADAGMVMLGKTNMDEFAMGSSNETSWFGRVANPWDRGCVPGGSSGGSAAAVAADLAPLATGTDTGGSIRQPAALCGLTGIKPTYGRVSRYGMVAFASSLDQGGPFARSARDAALLLSAMSGFDPLDSTSLDAPVPDYAAALGRPIDGLRIGLPAQYFDAGLDPAVRACIETAIVTLEAMGARRVAVDLPATPLSIPTYYVVAPAECSSNLSRYDGVRYGHRCEAPRDLLDLYERSRGEGFGPEVKRRILIGTYALSAGYYDAYYLQAQRVRRLIRDEFLAAFREADVLLGPTSPCVAFPFDSRTADPVTMYLSDVYTIAVNLAGLPALSIPCGLVGGLPVGLQLIGPHHGEQEILNVADAFQQQTDWHLRRPEGLA